MNFKLTTPAVAAALLIGVSAPAAASAAEASDWTSLGTVRGWTIVAAHDFCLASQNFTNDTELSFGMYSDGRAAIYIENKQWNIPEGKYPVVVSVDQTQPVTFTGKADGSLLSLLWQSL